MKWKTNIQLGRVNYNLELPRTIGEVAETYPDPSITLTYSLEDMVAFDAAVPSHNDSFIQQQCTDPLLTVANHYNGLWWATVAEVDIRDKLLDGQLIKLENLNIQRQHGAPFAGLVYNIDEGGMIDESIIISRRPLLDVNLPANGIPKTLPSEFGLRAGWQGIGNMEDIILCEMRRYQPDARFVATQPQTAATTWGDLGAPPEDPRSAGTRRFVSFSVSDVQTWGDTNLPIHGPTIYVYRYVRMYASQRQVQRFGTLNDFSGVADQAIADNLHALEMHLSCAFPAVRITMEGDAYDAELGELAVAYQKSLLQRARLERKVERDRRFSSTDDSSFSGGGGDHEADDNRENPDLNPEN